MPTLKAHVDHTSSAASNLMECIDRGDTEDTPIPDRDALILARTLIRTSMALVNTTGEVNEVDRDEIERALDRAIVHINAHL